jgi:ComF family protein
MQEMRHATDNKPRDKENSFFRDVKNNLNTLVDIVLPPRCVVSGDIVSHQGAVANHVWKELQFIQKPLCKFCGIPFDQEVAGYIDTKEESLCVECVHEKPVYGRARAALVYDDMSRNIILKFKHADQTRAIHSFRPWLLQAGGELFNETDLIVPVPLHYKRLIKRRYNQAAIIARALSEDTTIPWCSKTLTRIRSTLSQGNLSARQRYKNVQSAFSVPVQHQESLRGKTVLLVDDVYTTGATVKACAKSLLSAGAADVNILCVARVVK